MYLEFEVEGHFVFASCFPFSVTCRIDRADHRSDGRFLFRTRCMRHISTKKHENIVTCRRVSQGVAERYHSVHAADFRVEFLIKILQVLKGGKFDRRETNNRFTMSSLFDLIFREIATKSVHLRRRRGEDEETSVNGPHWVTRPNFWFPRYLIDL